MSRATNGVPMFGVRSGELLLQRWPNRWDTRTVAAMSSSASGFGSTLRKRSSCRSVRHSMGVLLPTPRGSNPTMSYASSKGAFTTTRAARA